MDINSGFVRDPWGLANMYEPEEGGRRDKAIHFSQAQYALYRGVIERIRLSAVSAARPHDPSAKPTRPLQL